MKFSLGQINKSGYNEPFRFDNYVNLSELETMNNDIRKIEPVHVYGTLTIQKDQIVASFTIEGSMILPCARTLVDVPYPFKINAVEIFSTAIVHHTEDDENEIHSIDGEMLDLTPYIKENILLEVPYRIFADNVKSEDAVPFHGDGWEFASPEKKEKLIDPRLKKLESLLDTNQKEE